MKATSTWTVLCLLVGVMLTGFASSSLAQSTVNGLQSPFPDSDLQLVSGDVNRRHGFAKSPYLLKSGGKPQTLKQMAAHPDGPRHFFRHENAYQAFKGGFEKALGRTLPDAAFVQLLGGSGVRDTTKCVGRIRTNGVSDYGNINQFNRQCYTGERLIEVKVNSRWKVVASQACLNQVFKVWSPQPKPKPQKCRWVSKTEIGSGIVLSSPGIHIHDEFCGHDVDINISGTYQVVPGSKQTHRQLVCE